MLVSRDLIAVQLRQLLTCIALLVIAGCVSAEKRVDLTYTRFANAKGGSGEVLVSKPTTQQKLQALPSGQLIIGRAGEADISINESPVDWVLSALVEELSAAGYKVKTAGTLSSDVSKEVSTKILLISANQSSNLLTITTVAEVKLEAQIRRNNQVIKTLTAVARDQEEGTDRSSEPIQSALEKTLQRTMEELIPEIIRNLD